MPVGDEQLILPLCDQIWDELADIGVWRTGCRYSRTGFVHAFLASYIIRLCDCKYKSFVLSIPKNRQNKLPNFLIKVVQYFFLFVHESLFTVLAIRKQLILDQKCILRMAMLEPPKLRRSISILKTTWSYTARCMVRVTELVGLLLSFAAAGHNSQQSHR